MSTTFAPLLASYITNQVMILKISKDTKSWLVFQPTNGVTKSLFFIGAALKILIYEDGFKPNSMFGKTIPNYLHPPPNLHTKAGHTPCKIGVIRLQW